jgi:predicted ATP-grasp superfamily ATP-dependent carboligase
MMIPTRTNHAEGRQEVDVLVLDAQFRQALSAMRSLSKSGVRVGAIVCRSEADNAIAQRSRWCRMSAVVPDFAQDPAGYLDSIFELLDAYPAAAIVPCDDGSIETLRTRRSGLERRIALPLASEAALESALSKIETLALARRLGIAIPRSVTVTTSDNVRRAMDEIGYPAVIKPSRSWVAGRRNGTRLVPEIVNNLNDAQRSVDGLHVAGAQAIVQQWLPGAREAVTLFYANDRVWAKFVQRSYRELPVLGGASVLCESMPPFPALVEPAERLVRAMQLEGCSMVEFRRDRDGQPRLMEVNPRLPGSVALAISAGVDFPQLLYAWAIGAPLQSVTSYQVGRRLRWFAGDLWSLRASLSGSKEPDTPGRASAVARFLFDFVSRPSRLDVVDRNDMGPAIVELRQMILKPALRRISPSAHDRRCRSGRSTTTRVQEP